ncbi:hypothetical protein TrRE_jg6556, partial [Triparma retinervis]
MMLSTKLDDWNHEQLDVMDMIGNTRGNEKYEFHVPDEFLKPHHQENRFYREKYIREKYEERGFMQRTRKPPTQNPTPLPPPPPQLGKKSKNGPASNIGMIEFIGYINVTLVRGENLLRMGFHGSDGETNPYAKLQLGGQMVQSKVAHNTCDPEWEETMMLCWDGIEELHLDVFSSDEHMGGHTLPLLYLLDEEAARVTSDSIASQRSGGGGDSVISACPDLGSISETGEDSGEEVEGGEEGREEGREEGGRRETNSVLLGDTERGKKGKDGTMYLQLEHRDTTKVGKKTMGLKTKTKRAARGSVFRPREATGGIMVK